MNPQDIFCPNIDCPARGQVGKGNIGVHSQKEKRYKCNVCGEAFGSSTNLLASEGGVIGGRAFVFPYGTRIAIEKQWLGG